MSLKAQEKKKKEEVGKSEKEREMNEMEEKGKSCVHLQNAPIYYFKHYKAVVKRRKQIL